MILKEIKENSKKILLEVKEKEKEHYYYGSTEIKNGDCTIMVSDLKEMYDEEGYSCEIAAEIFGKFMILQEATAPIMSEAVVTCISKIYGLKISSLYELEKQIEEEEASNQAYWEACEQEELNMM